MRLEIYLSRGFVYDLVLELRFIFMVYEVEFFLLNSTFFLYFCRTLSLVLVWEGCLI